LWFNPTYLFFGVERKKGRFICKIGEIDSFASKKPIFMDIREFVELSTGKWFSQRTVHNLSSGQLQAGKSDLFFEILAPTDPSVIKLCSQQAIHPTADSVFALNTNWNGSFMDNPVKGSTVIVFIPDEDNLKEGKVLQENGLPTRYIMSDNDILTLITEAPDLYAEEKLWFLSSNLRLHSSILRESNRFTQASFRSAIRMGAAPELANTVSNAQAI
jgi:CpeS-like protein